jgi:hypothetical protein
MLTAFPPVDRHHPALATCEGLVSLCRESTIRAPAPVCKVSYLLDRDNRKNSRHGGSADESKDNVVGSAAAEREIAPPQDRWQRSLSSGDREHSGFVGHSSDEGRGADESSNSPLETTSSGGGRC